MAGIALLVDGGWDAVTSRAVATRAESNPGLIHYHFGGLRGLRVAIAERASDEAIGPLVDVFASSDDFATVFARLSSNVEVLVADDRRVRLAAHLVAGAANDPELGSAFRQNLVSARTLLIDWVANQRPQWAREQAVGVGTLIAALIDGLLLHRAVDASVPMREAIAVLGACVEESTEGIR